MREIDDSSDEDRRAKGGKENKINRDERVSQRPPWYVANFGGIKWLVLAVVVVGGLLNFGENVVDKDPSWSCNGNFVYRYAAISFAARVVVRLPRRRRTRTPEYWPVTMADKCSVVYMQVLLKRNESTPRN